MIALDSVGWDGFRAVSPTLSVRSSRLVDHPHITHLRAGSGDVLGDKGRYEWATAAPASAPRLMRYSRQVSHTTSMSNNVRAISPNVTLYDSR